MRCKAGEVFFTDIPPDLQDTHYALEIWGAWNRSSQKQVGTCGSLENRYRPEDEAGKPKVLHPRLNQDTAEKVQMAILKLTKQHRFVLQYWYVHKLNPYFIKRKLGIQNLNSVYSQLNAARYSIKSFMSGN
jgi:hypothetical protein